MAAELTPERIPGFEEYPVLMRFMGPPKTYEHDDVATEYAILDLSVRNPEWIGAVMVAARWERDWCPQDNFKWEVNPWGAARPMARMLLAAETENATLRAEVEQLRGEVHDCPVCHRKCKECDCKEPGLSREEYNRRVSLGAAP